MQRKSFNLEARIRSVIYASRGLGYAVKTQQSLWIAIILVISILGISFWIGLDNFELAIIIVALGTVLAMEVMNTAIEQMVNLLSPEWRARAGLVKDLAAGAVLLSSITAVVIVLLILGPPMLDKL